MRGNWEQRGILFTPNLHEKGLGRGIGKLFRNIWLRFNKRHLKYAKRSQIKLKRG